MDHDDIFVEGHPFRDLDPAARKYALDFAISIAHDKLFAWRIAGKLRQISLRHDFYTNDSILFLTFEHDILRLEIPRDTVNNTMTPSELSRGFSKFFTDERVAKIALRLKQQ